MAFVREHKIVTESAKSFVPSVVRFMVGHDYKGNWWSLPKSALIYNALQPIREHPEVHVCRLVRQKVTFLHKDVWAPLICLSERLPAGALDKVVEIHEDTGRHRTEILATPDWAPTEVVAEVRSMTVDQARARLVASLPNGESVLSSLRL